MSAAANAPSAHLPLPIEPPSGPAPVPRSRHVATFTGSPSHDIDLVAAIAPYLFHHPHYRPMLLCGMDSALRLADWSPPDVVVNGGASISALTISNESHVRAGFPANTPAA